ncbi:hypothetical protein C7399_112159 [Paraburkholderia tropica]|uniref:Uncharacterized protein n=1 Tax=Paraburkholderia tropica TaxID=92647 RepID=A0ABX5MN16_9BURK|nr:hypothetical protein [Paraburkholderia tropica]PXX14548.1 hypothetical protein C7400_112160 [Paraburkholderia tropica]PZW79613.1 hypothetical protein C7399_112159 [Paraburkholderia tropica]
MNTHRDIKICTKSSSGLRDILFAHVSPNGRRVTFGFTDKAFVVPNVFFDSEHVHLEKIHGAQSVRNPHFTLHDGTHFHLKSTNGTVLLEGLVWSSPAPGEECSPWLRFVSNPVSHLKQFKGIPHGRQVDMMILQGASDDHSIAIDVDFVSEAPSAGSAKPYHRYIAAGQITIRLAARAVPAQEATLGYKILG